MSLKEMIKLKPIVEILLTRYPQLRDSDNKLIANIWAKQIKDVHSLSTHEFLKLFGNNKLYTPESITRMRRKLQEEFPYYRGDKYEKRHREADLIKEKIKDI